MQNMLDFWSMRILYTGTEGINEVILIMEVKCLVKVGKIMESTPSTKGNNMEVLTVELDKIVVTSVYKPQGTSFLVQQQ